MFIGVPPALPPNDLLKSVVTIIQDKGIQAEAQTAYRTTHAATML